MRVGVAAERATLEHQRGIFLYEDDMALAGEIAAAFRQENQEISHVTRAPDLREAVRSGQACALIMDRMVYDKDSLALIAEMRAAGDRVPVVVISSLSAVDDRIRGLKAGGDDYLVKPFAMGELIARVEALRRRVADDRQTNLKAGPLEMDLIARSVRRGARTIDLVPREFGLLEYLMRHAGQVVTRSMLLEDVWHYNVATHTNVVDVHVGNLRRKIDGPDEERLIASVRGLGFRLDV